MVAEAVDAELAAVGGAKQGDVFIGPRAQSPYATAFRGYRSLQVAEELAERLMWDLRSLAASGVLRLIFAGYVKIHERRLNPRSAFHNFTTFRRLGALTKEAARTLIRAPLNSLDIQLSSEPGKGTTFSVLLPAHTPVAAA